MHKKLFLSTYQIQERWSPCETETETVKAQMAGNNIMCYFTNPNNKGRNKFPTSVYGDKILEIK